MAIATFHFIKALEYLERGFAVRRASWNDAVGGHPLAWVVYAYGLYYYKTSAGIAVVKADEVTVNDMRAGDWTLQGIDGAPADVSGTGTVKPSKPGQPPSTGDINNPNPSPTPADDGGNPQQPGGGAGGGGGGGTGGDGSDDNDDDEPISRTPPTINVTVNNITGGCVTRAENGEPSNITHTDNFTAEAALGVDPFAKPGEVWFLKITALGEIRYNGTVAPGGNASISFSAPNPANRRGESVNVNAVARLANVGLSASGSGSANLRNDCDEEGS